MGTARAQGSYGSATAAIQCGRILTQMRATMVSAGYALIRISADSGVSLYRPPALDASWSHAETVMLQLRSSTSASMVMTLDCDVQQSSWANSTSPTIAWGLSSFPGGLPIRSSPQFNAFVADIIPTTSAFTCTTYASDYGIIVIYDDGITPKLGYLARPIHSPRQPRRQQVITRFATFPITFNAPVGPAHVTFSIDGHEESVTFPTGVALDEHRIIQEINLQMRGLAIAAIEYTFSGTVIFIRRIPDMPPIFDYSIGRPSFGVTYVDAEADDLNLAIYIGSVNAVTANTLTVNNVNWVTQSVRIGATILNRTRGETALVTGYTTASTLHDTLSIVTPPGWSSFDTYLVLPGPEDISHGASQHGGSYQATPLTSSNVVTQPDGSVIVALSDLYGEAQGHYQKGQTVMCANNGYAVTLTMTDVTNLTRGSTLSHLSTASQGIIREIYPATSQIVVDTIVGPSALAFNGVTWPAGTCISDAGLTTIMSSRSASVASDNSLGWISRAVITDIGQVDTATGDYRTKLTLNVSGMNASARFSPGFVVSIWAKLTLLFNMNSGSTNPPAIFGYNTLNWSLANDICRNDNTVLAGSSPKWEPDYETGNLMLGECVLRAVTTFGNDLVLTLPHLRSVNDRTTFVIGDALDEDGDPNRRWRLFFSNPNVATLYSTAMVGGTSLILAVGPGAL